MQELCDAVVEAGIATKNQAQKNSKIKGRRISDEAEFDRSVVEETDGQS